MPLAFSMPPRYQGAVRIAEGGPHGDLCMETFVSRPHAFAGLVSMLRPRRDAGCLRTMPQCVIRAAQPDAARARETEILYGISAAQERRALRLPGPIRQVHTSPFPAAGRATQGSQIIEMNTYWGRHTSRFCCHCGRSGGSYRSSADHFAGDQVAEGLVLIARAEHHAAGGSNAKR